MGYVNIHGEPLFDAGHLSRQLQERRRLQALGVASSRKPTVKNGYAAPPGTGPAGETCGTCQHKHSMSSNSGSKRFIKCLAAQERWTHGEGSDILAKSPACRAWKRREGGQC